MRGLHKPMCTQTQRSEHTVHKQQLTVPLHAKFEFQGAWSNTNSIYRCSIQGIHFEYTLHILCICCMRSHYTSISKVYTIRSTQLTIKYLGVKQILLQNIIFTLINNVQRFVVDFCPLSLSFSSPVRNCSIGKEQRLLLI